MDERAVVGDKVDPASRSILLGGVDEVAHMDGLDQVLALANGIQLTA